MGRSASAIRMIWRKPEVKEYFRRYLEVIDILSGIALGRLRLDAVQACRDILLQRADLKLLLDAARDVLDRTGVGTHKE